MSAGDGTAIVAWQDYRANQYLYGYPDIYSQKASSSPTGISRTPLAPFSVSENRPNQFQTATAFDVELERPSRVRIEVFDVSGRRVWASKPQDLPAGVKTLRIDGRDQRGRLLPSGVYFYRVHAGAETVTRKMVIAR